MSYPNQHHSLSKILLFSLTRNNEKMTSEIFSCLIRRLKILGKDDEKFRLGF